MTKYIALLRGINVGGYRKIKMDDLKGMFGSMDFQNIATYIQSGNVIFEAPEKQPDELSTRISMQIDTTFGHDVPVVIRTPKEVQDAFRKYPFEEKDGWKGYISFLSNQPTPLQKKELEAQSSAIEKFRILEKELYSLVDKQADQKPLLSNRFVEKQLGMFATTRNLRTVRKVLELAGITMDS